MLLFLCTCWHAWAMHHVCMLYAYLLKMTFIPTFYAFLMPFHATPFVISLFRKYCTMNETHFDNGKSNLQRTCLQYTAVLVLPSNIFDILGFSVFTHSKSHHHHGYIANRYVHNLKGKCNLRKTHKVPWNKQIQTVKRHLYIFADVIMRLLLLVSPRL